MSDKDTKQGASSGPFLFVPQGVNPRAWDLYYHALKLVKEIDIDPLPALWLEIQNDRTSYTKGQYWMLKTFTDIRINNMPGANKGGTHAD